VFYDDSSDSILRTKYSAQTVDVALEINDANIFGAKKINATVKAY
jgi:hypothetical protein